MLTLDPATIPAQPAPASEAARLSELLDNDLPRFALSFDGYEHVGERWPEVLRARREEWEQQGTLPRDVAALRALLFLTFRQERFVTLDGAAARERAGSVPAGPPDPELITDARREHEAFKHALLARIRELASAPTA